MYKKIFILVSSLILSFSLNLSAAQTMGYDSSMLNDYSPQFSKAIEMIHKVPEARQLIQTVQKDGRVKVRPGTFEITKQFGACWESQTRTIFLNMDRTKDVGEMVNTIIFELHNALATGHLDDLTAMAAEGKIEKENYVEGIERTEHNNALRTSDLLESGIQRGIFPVTARWPVPRNFVDHYRLQQVHGHSQQIAMQFDEFSPRRPQPYRGTIPGLNSISEQDRQDLLLFLSIKHDLESGSRQHEERGLSYLRNEWNQIQGCRSGTFYGDCSRVDRKEYLMNFVLSGNNQFERLRG